MTTAALDLRIAGGVTVLLARAGRDARGAAHTLLLDAAASALAVPKSRLRLEHEPDGRPLLTGTDHGLHVSLSHGRGVVAVALTGLGPVGVDVERVRPLPAARMAHRWLAAEEAAWVDRQPKAEQPDAFLQLWVQKEAAGKAAGTGLRAGGMRRLVLPPGSSFGTRLVPLPTDPALAVCVPPADPAIALAVALHGAGGEAVPVAVHGSPLL